MDWRRTNDQWLTSRRSLLGLKRAIQPFRLPALLFLFDWGSGLRGSAVLVLDLGEEILNREIGPRNVVVLHLELSLGDSDGTILG